MMMQLDASGLNEYQHLLEPRICTSVEHERRLEQKVAELLDTESVSGLKDTRANEKTGWYHTVV